MSEPGLLNQQQQDQEGTNAPNSAATEAPGNPTRERLRGVSYAEGAQTVTYSGQEAAPAPLSEERQAQIERARVESFRLLDGALGLPTGTSQGLRGATLEELLGLPSGLASEMHPADMLEVAESRGIHDQERLSQESASDLIGALGLPSELGGAPLTFDQIRGVLEGGSTVMTQSGLRITQPEQEAIAFTLRGLGYDGSQPLTPQLLELGLAYQGVIGQMNNDQRARDFSRFQWVVSACEPRMEGPQWYIHIPGVEAPDQSVIGQMAAGAGQSVGEEIVGLAIAPEMIMILGLLQGLSQIVGQIELERWNIALSRGLSGDGDRDLDTRMRNRVAAELRQGMSNRESVDMYAGERNALAYDSARESIEAQIQQQLQDLGAYSRNLPRHSMSAN